MIDWSQLEELYCASTSDNERARNTALGVIEANIDAWVEEYRLLPENAWDWDSKLAALPRVKKGQPRFATYEELARWVTCWLMYERGEWEDYRKKAEELTADKLGILLRHRKHERARQLHENDWDFCTIFGERYMLALTPAVAPGDIAPQRKEFVFE